MNKVAKDLLPVRETQVSSSDALEKDEEIFAVCLETDDAELLVPFKIYLIALRGEYAHVIDEHGEPSVYPKNFFLPLPLPPATVNALSSAYAHSN